MIFLIIKKVIKVFLNLIGGLRTDARVVSHEWGWRRRRRRCLSKINHLIVRGANDRRRRERCRTTRNRGRRGRGRRGSRAGNQVTFLFRFRDSPFTL